MNLANICGVGWEVSQKIGTALFFNFKVNLYNVYVLQTCLYLYLYLYLYVSRVYPTVILRIHVARVWKFYIQLALLFFKFQGELK